MAIRSPEVRSRKSVGRSMRSPEVRSRKNAGRRGTLDSNRRRSTGSSFPSPNKNKTLLVSTNQPKKGYVPKKQITTTTKRSVGCDWCRGLHYCTRCDMSLGIKKNPRTRFEKRFDKICSYVSSSSSDDNSDVNKPNDDGSEKDRIDMLLQMVESNDDDSKSMVLEKESLPSTDSLVIVDKEQAMEMDSLSNSSVSNSSSDGSYHHIINEEDEDEDEDEDRNPNNISRDSTLGIRKRWDENEVNNHSLMTLNNSFETHHSMLLMKQHEQTEDDKEQRIEVLVPAGKLGVVLYTKPLTNAIPEVWAINESSILAGTVQVGDRIITVDDQDTMNMDADDVSELINMKKDEKCRSIVFLRPPLHGRIKHRHEVKMSDELDGIESVD